MKDATKNYLLRVLDSQLAHVKRRPDDELQMMYYLGMKEAVDAAMSEGYTQGGFVTVDENGKHSISK